MDHARQYSDRTLDEMQLVYGEGYLSPGGAEEVDALLDGVTVRGRRVLDLGCGVGGAAIRIVRELGAGTVLGIDVEERALGRATAAVEAAGLAGRITFELVSPGPFPLPDESVDIVFCKDVVSHLADKEPLFAEVARVLRSGGVFAFGDWTTGSAPEAPGTVRRPDGLVLHFEPLERYRQGLGRNGFTSIGTRDHSAWLLERTRRELDTVLRLREERSDPDSLEDRIAVARRRLHNLQCGRLEHWHVQASRVGEPPMVITPSARRAASLRERGPSAASHSGSGSLIRSE